MEKKDLEVDTTPKKNRFTSRISKTIGAVDAIHYTLDSVVELRKHVKKNWAEVRR